MRHTIDRPARWAVRLSEHRYTMHSIAGQRHCRHVHALGRSASRDRPSREETCSCIAFRPCSNERAHMLANTRRNDMTAREIHTAGTLSHRTRVDTG